MTFFAFLSCIPRRAIPVSIHSLILGKRGTLFSEEQDAIVYMKITGCKGKFSEGTRGKETPVNWWTPGSPRLWVEYSLNVLRGSGITVNKTFLYPFARRKLFPGFAQGYALTVRRRTLYPLAGRKELIWVCSRVGVYCGEKFSVSFRLWKMSSMDYSRVCGLLWKWELCILSLVNRSRLNKQKWNQRNNGHTWRITDYL